MAVPAAVPPKSSTPKPISHARTTSQASARNSTAPTPVTRRTARSTTPDYLSDKATAAFIRRTLCPQQNGDAGRNAAASIEELLPPLTSRNDVDLQLYAFLAVILKEFVQAWYGKITPDETFVAEIVQIIAHITRALEQRLRKVDLESLLLDEIPDLLDRHITARRAARNPIVRPPTQVNPREVYHSLCPLPYLSPVPNPDAPETVESQRENERSYRQLLVRGVLAILLPTEDVENPCLTSLVGEILSETIIGNIIANKASQPWLLWEGFSILARNITEAKKRRKKRDDPQASSASASQGFSVQWLLFSAIHWIFLAYTSIRFLVTTLATASSFPRRASRSLSEKGDLTSQDTTDNTNTPVAPLAEGDQVLVPLVDFRIWPCIGNLIELQSRMPWLAGTVALLQLGLLEGPGRIGDVDRIMDRTLSHLLRQHLLDPSRLPPLLRTLRAALFPNNAPGTPSLFAPTSDEQLLALRRRTATSLASLVPPQLASLYFGGRPPWRSPSASKSGATVSLGDVAPKVVDAFDEVFLDLFADEYCNKHLMYSVVELILVRLLPELTEKRVSELWEERLN